MAPTPVLRLVIALLPLATVPLLVFLVGNGHLDFGGGEKDILLLAPWALWSLLFAASSLWLWARGWSLSRSVARSAMVGIAGVVLAGVVLAMAGQLGVGGRV